MIKMILTVVVALASAGSGYACSLKSSDTATVRQVVKQRGGYPISDEFCNFLNKQGLSLNVNADSTVLAGVSIAWVNISLIHLDTGIVSNTFSSHTKVDAGRASQDVADDLLYAAIRQAASNFELLKAAGEIKRYRAKK